MIIPAERDHLTIFHPEGGLTRYEFGEWIVLDWEFADAGTWAVYRRPTPEEMDGYGLNV
ncbi:hypothetical protein MINTM005_13870 [Mycobacterium intracellulare]|uniref:hypothetical protein n=1 Tax=Mycobacterium intracellulare TaxID=1767 RepID=UPI001925E050|nr:hypothetical protein [Mycobacterium intracellulare]BCO56143.1 hypothetical protein MINTM005_13870 [Mycobacterium intracellulare]